MIYVVYGICHIRDALACLVAGYSIASDFIFQIRSIIRHIMYMRGSCLLCSQVQLKKATSPPGISFVEIYIYTYMYKYNI